MKDYMKPELEVITFATESVTDDGVIDPDGGQTSNNINNFG